MAQLGKPAASGSEIDWGILANPSKARAAEPVASAGGERVVGRLLCDGGD